MSFTSSMRISGSSLTAQRLRMDVISGNIANVSTTRDVDGSPYRRREVVLSASYSPQGSDQSGILKVGSRSASPMGVRVAGIASQDQIRLVNDPNHPDADAEGNVAYPDIDMVQEMADMMTAIRAYEASVTALNAAKSMAQKALDLGRA